MKHRFLFLSLLILLLCLAAFGLQTKTGSAHKESTQQPKPSSQKTKRPFEQTYKEVLTDRAQVKQKQLHTELRSLQLMTEKYEPALLDAQKKSGFNQQAALAMFRTAIEERDPVRKKLMLADFRSKYQPELTKLAEAAAIDPANIRQQIISELNLGSVRQGAGDTTDVETGDEPREPERLPPVSGSSEGFLRAPFTAAGTQGRSDLIANNETGVLRIWSQANPVADSVQSLAFISQELEIRAGERQLRVFATFSRVNYVIDQGAFLGYASSEAIVNLRVMEGSHEICSDRMSLSRVINAVIGFPGPVRGDRPVQLQCEIVRAEPEYATTYNLVAEIEGWVGCLGPFSGSSLLMNAVVQDFRVIRPVR